MPTDYTTMSTTDLLDLLTSTAKGQTFNAIMSEIASRIVENTYSDPDMRGGIRPTHRPS